MLSEFEFALILICHCENFAEVRSNPVKRQSRLLKRKFANNKRLTALLDCFEFFKLSQ
jgi:hypothetical protein